MGLKLRSLQKDHRRSTYLSDIFRAEAEGEDFMYILKRNRVPLTLEQQQFMQWLMQHPHPSLLIPVEIRGEVGEHLEEIYPSLSLPSLNEVLDRILPQSPFWQFQQVWVVMEQLTSVLGYLHSHGYIHHDVRDRNIFVDPRTLEITLFDYNSVRRPYFLEAGVNSWNEVPPEYRLGGTMIDFSFDVYQAGKLFRKMVCGYEREPKVKITDGAIEVMHKACAEEREQRYANGTELHQAIIGLASLVTE